MKHTLSGYVEPTARRLAQELGLELVDVELVKESTGKFLRFLIDQPEGVDLDALERFVTTEYRCSTLREYSKRRTSKA